MCGAAAERSSGALDIMGMTPARSGELGVVTRPQAFAVGRAIPGWCGSTHWLGASAEALCAGVRAALARGVLAACVWCCEAHVRAMRESARHTRQCRRRPCPGYAEGSGGGGGGGGGSGMCGVVCAICGVV